MMTLTQARTDLGTRRKLRSFERFLNHHSDSLTRRFGSSEAALKGHSPADLVPNLCGQNT